MVIHILKDGKTVNDITGHVVKYADVPELYEVMKRIHKRLNHEKNN